MEPNKLTFIACRENNGKFTPISDRKEFSVMLNPEDFSVETKTFYDDGKTSGKHKFLKFKSRSTPRINIPKLIFDVTGAIPKNEWPKDCTTIAQMIKKLKAVVYDLDGESHQPPIVKIKWGIFSYPVRIEKFNIKYTLFDLKGTPLRAEVSLDIKFFYQAEGTQEEKKSPDLTHLVEVKAGDTLPLMCARVYNNSSYYLQIAKINGLTNFRNLKPGTMLEFPPIRD
ncbi:MAG: hypothetical protein IKM81_12670 [Fibrobacter sp.]|nr:hypothetical protein [Fibrobacter sp.]